MRWVAGLVGAAVFGVAGCGTAELGVPVSELGQEAGAAVWERDPVAAGFDSRVRGLLAGNFTVTVDSGASLPVFSVERAGGVLRVERSSGGRFVVTVVRGVSSCSASFGAPPSPAAEASASWSCGPVDALARSAVGLLSGLVPSVQAERLSEAGAAEVRLRNFVSSPWSSFDLVALDASGGVVGGVTYALDGGVLDVSLLGVAEGMPAFVRVEPGSDWRPAGASLG